MHDKPRELPNRTPQEEQEGQTVPPSAQDAPESPSVHAQVPPQEECPHLLPDRERTGYPGCIVLEECVQQ